VKSGQNGKEDLKEMMDRYEWL